MFITGTRNLKTWFFVCLGAMLFRFTKDKKLQVSEAPHVDVEWKYYSQQAFAGMFYPGNKMLLRFIDGKSYTAEFLGQFPSHQVAEERLRILEAEVLPLSCAVVHFWKAVTRLILVPSGGKELWGGDQV